MFLQSVSCLGQVSDISDIYLMCLKDVPDISYLSCQVSDRADIYQKYQTDVLDISEGLGGVSDMSDIY